MIEEKQHYYTTNEAFEAQRDAGNIPEDAVVYVEDTQKMYTHGGKFSVGTVSAVSEDSHVDGDVISITDAILSVPQQLTQQSKNIALNNILAQNINVPKNIIVLENKADNILTQEDFQDENTIYIIQQYYDLDGKNINIPNNCTLVFIGGSLNNGSIFINNADVLPKYDRLESADQLVVSGVPVQGTMKWNKELGIPMWSNGEKWVTATGK